MMNERLRLLRITTVPISLKLLLRGQLAFMQENGFEVLAVSADGPEVEEIRSEGIRHEVVHMTRVISPFRDLVSLFRLIRVIQKFKPQIVHTHTPKAGLLGMMAAWICRVPIRLHTVAGLPLMERKGIVRDILVLTEKITYASATSVYINSTGLKAFIESNIHTSTPLKIIGRGSSNGIDIKFFSPAEAIRNQAQLLRAEHQIAPDCTVFCFIGRVVRDKGVNELLAAFNQLSQTKSCKLFLAGPFEDALDPISVESRKIIAENTDVVVLGYVHDVRPVLMASDVFVFPSYREGFPNVVMQACCMGVPSIVSDINGCNEIVVDGETGVVVRPKDTAALHNAMSRLADEVALRKLFATRARKFVLEHFDQGHVWDALLTEYKTALNTLR